MKQGQLYLIKTWGTCVVVAPLLSTLLLINNIARPSFQEILLTIGLSITLGFLYFFVDVLVACLVLGSMVKPKVVPALGCMFGVLILQLFILYKYNLSFIYKGTPIVCLCYIAVFLAAAWLYRPKPIIDSV